MKVLESNANKERQFDLVSPARTYHLQCVEKGDRNSVKGMIVEGTLSSSYTHIFAYC